MPMVKCSVCSEAFDAFSERARMERQPANWLVEGQGDDIKLLSIGEEGQFYTEVSLDRYSAIWLAEGLLLRARQGMREDARGALEDG